MLQPNYMNATKIIIGVLVVVSASLFVLNRSRDVSEELVSPYVFEDSKFEAKEIIEIRIYKIDHKLYYKNETLLIKEKFNKAVISGEYSTKLWKIFSNRLFISTIPDALPYDNQNFQLIAQNKNGEITTIIVSQIFYSLDETSAYVIGLSGYNYADKWAVRMNREDIESIGLEWRPFGSLRGAALE
jgi:hypothetical protein